MKRKLLQKITALFCAGALVLTAGCGSQGTAPEPAPVTEEETPAEVPEVTEPTAEEPVTEEPAAPTALSGEINLWTWTDSMLGIKEEFEAAYPDVTLNVEIFGGDEYKTKLLTTLQSGTDIPDLFMLEEGYIYEFLDSDLIENLSERGYEEKMSEYHAYMLGACRAADGTIRAVDYQSSPVCYWYLRDAMEEWMGTSDPAELAQQLNSWDAILAASQKVYEESNGTVYLWPNLSEMPKVVAYSFRPFVQDGVFEISDEWLGLVDTMRTFQESGYIADLGSWGEEWATAWNAGELLIRVMPSWDFFTDWETNEGNVGVIQPFESAYEGNSFVSMYAKSEKKDLCDAFLTYLTSPEFQRINMEKYNQVPANASVAKAMADEGFSAPRFGGQNLMETYFDINENVYDVKLDKYTRALTNLFQKHANEGIRGGLDNAAIIENFKAEARDMYPELNIE